MYAIIDDGGKQYKVEPGQSLCVELRELGEDAGQLEFPHVLFYQDGETTLVGTPRVEGAKVLAKVSGEAFGPKVYPMQFRRRKDSRRRIGHRQKYLQVEITEIQKGG
ncbi:MAG: 50S ribosomal protein L21 [Sedimentisphaerales bacterium]|nr:50S ribosomal protein L21 [Sedimentisphaerales bacterium]